MSKPHQSLSLLSHRVYACVDRKESSFSCNHEKRQLLAVSVHHIERFIPAYYPLIENCDGFTSNVQHHREVMMISALHQTRKLNRTVSLHPSNGGLWNIYSLRHFSSNHAINNAHANFRPRSDTCGYVR